MMEGNVQPSPIMSGSLSDLSATCTCSTYCQMGMRNDVQAPAEQPFHVHTVMYILYIGCIYIIKTIICDERVCASL